MQSMCPCLDGPDTLKDFCCYDCNGSQCVSGWSGHTDTHTQVIVVTWPYWLYTRVRMVRTRHYIYAASLTFDLTYKAMVYSKLTMVYQIWMVCTREEWRKHEVFLCLMTGWSRQEGAYCSCTQILAYTILCLASSGHFRYFKWEYLSSLSEWQLYISNSEEWVFALYIS